ncbi:LysM peptidoglycan-binding domain-containing protein [Latilactobacillus fuchuensis]|uniref:aggregation-promoting factor n=1 Tax=Latilactobacillus fuchuensis TaxID=164393 RepID=UPI0020C786D7|nr:LysM peptidoglycan-binding domain-containing protein [Latilactobacillus fuchuensis]MCP8858407.1 LysM peptidoglycan-binding domain-containing protein [Latilactobacillus fuchuensis]
MTPLKTILFSTTLTAATAAGILFAGNGQASAATTYTVTTGDTLSSISNKFAGNNDLVDSIAKNNSISNINLIYVGEQLTIDADTTASTTTQAAAPVAQTTTPVATTQTVTPVQAATVTPAATTTTATAATTSSSKEWIAQKESGGSYTATNGQLIGRYQLSASYLNGDYSAANQEKVADQYVTSRYGSWDAAKSFWLSNGWY